MVKLQLFVIGGAVTMSYLLFVIRHLLLARGRNKKIPYRAYLLRPVEDEDGPDRDDYLIGLVPDITNLLGRDNHLRPPPSGVAKAGSMQASCPMGIKADRLVKA
jgi:hypothetical protein